MKYKYFLRGFGFGILFATLILMIAFTIREKLPQNNSSNKDVLSSEVKDKNDKKDDEQNKESEKSSEEDDRTSNKDDGEISSNKENANKDTTSKEETNKEGTDIEGTDIEGTDIEETDKEETSEEEVTSEEDTSVEETSTEKESEEPTSEEESSSEINTDIPEIPVIEPQTTAEMVLFSLNAGMSSNQVAQALKDLGVVDSASDFNHYMESNGLAKRLRIGVYYVPKNASYTEIANILIKRS